MTPHIGSPARAVGFRVVLENGDHGLGYVSAGVGVRHAADGTARISPKHVVPVRVRRGEGEPETAAAVPLNLIALYEIAQRRRETENDAIRAARTDDVARDPVARGPYLHADVVVVRRDRVVHDDVVVGPDARSDVESKPGDERIPLEDVVSAVRSVQTSRQYRSRHDVPPNIAAAHTIDGVSRAGCTSERAGVLDSVAEEPPGKRTSGRVRIVDGGGERRAAAQVAVDDLDIGRCGGGNRLTGLTCHHHRQILQAEPPQDLRLRVVLDASIRASDAPIPDDHVRAGSAWEHADPRGCSSGRR